MAFLLAPFLLVSKVLRLEVDRPMPRGTMPEGQTSRGCWRGVEWCDDDVVRAQLAMDHPWQASPSRAVGRREVGRGVKGRRAAYEAFARVKVD